MSEREGREQERLDAEVEYRKSRFDEGSPSLRKAHMRAEKAEAALATAQAQVAERDERIKNFERYVEREIEPKLLAQLERQREALPDPGKLGEIAEMLDLFDELLSLLAPGALDGRFEYDPSKRNEMQSDLRRWSKSIAALSETGSNDG